MEEKKTDNEAPKPSPENNLADAYDKMVSTDALSINSEDYWFLKLNGGAQTGNK
ncbi:MAG: hypothetical protein MJY47_01415 [Fibrobacter sp.]|nr:hypothetical protein [Fibrobacter sp.]